MNTPRHIAIVGGSGSGKTWLAEATAAALASRAVRVSLDDFYRDLAGLPFAEREHLNFDDPAAIDWETLRRVFDSFQAGQPAVLPVYDFATHTRRPETRQVNPAPLIIWDGLWLLHHPWLRHRFDRRIFVDCPAGLRYERRAARDLRERGRTPESVHRQFHEQVEPMHRQFVEPQRATATHIFPSPPPPGALDRLLLELRSSLENLEPLLTS